MNKLTSGWRVLTLCRISEIGPEIDRGEKLIYRAPAKSRATAKERFPEESLQRGMFSVIGLLGLVLIRATKTVRF